MGAKIGDTIMLPLDFSGYFGDASVMKLFALMVVHMEDTHVDFDRLTLRHKGQEVPLSVFGISPEMAKFDLYYELAYTYDKPGGKFHLIFSNSALIDCHYVFTAFITAIEVNLEAIKIEHPKIYDDAIVILNDISSWLVKEGLTFCDFAYDLNGVLKDQSSYYLSSYDEI